MSDGKVNQALISSQWSLRLTSLDLNSLSKVVEKLSKLTP